MGLSCYKKTTESEIFFHTNSLRNMNQNINSNIKDFLNKSNENENDLQINSNKNIKDHFNNIYNEGEKDIINNNYYEKKENNNHFNSSFEKSNNNSYINKQNTFNTGEINITFIINDLKELYILVKSSNTFKEVIEQLKEKYNWIQNYNNVSYYYNNEKIDELKTIEELGIKNNDIIKIIAD